MPDIDDAIEIRCEDGKIAREGDRVWSHYSAKWGTIRPGSVSCAGYLHPGEDVDPGVHLWFDVDQDDGGRARLNGERVSTWSPRHPDPQAGGAVAVEAAELRRLAESLVERMDRLVLSGQWISPNARRDLIATAKVLSTAANYFS